MRLPPGIVKRSLLDGFRGLRRRPGLSVLLYMVILALSVTVTIPLYVVLEAASGSTGYGSLMVERFDMILVSGALKESGRALLGTIGMVVWLLPVVILWKVAAAMGLINALRSGSVRSFWEGVGRFTGPGLVLSLLNLVVLGVWIVLTAMATAALVAILPGGSSPEIPAAAAVLMAAAGFALFGLMQDYARISHVCDGLGIVDSWLEGLRYPLRYPRAVLLYAFWWAGAAVVSGALLQMHVSWAPTMQQVWMLFFGSQLLLLVRSAGTVAWTGSAVGLHERIRFVEAPLIALNTTGALMASEERPQS